LEGGGIRSFTEAQKRHDIAAMIDLVSDQCVFENNSPAPNGKLYQGKEAIAQFRLKIFTQWPDANNKIEDILGFDLRCKMLWSCNWSNDSGNKGRLRGVEICRLQDGTIHEGLSYVKG
jgi:hypothetical protein